MFLVSCNTRNEEEILDLRKIKFNDGWEFSYGNNLKESVPVQIPHDWSIEGEIRKDNPSGRQGGFYPGGAGYYQKNFEFDDSWKDKQVLITFDGVMSNSEIWFNGNHLVNRPNGYV